MWSGGAEAETRVPRAASALCSLYHEAGQRLRRLQDQLAARDALIARLRARLAAHETDTAPSLVDALLEQVARYREQLRRQESDASEEAAALRQEIERLKEQLETGQETQGVTEPLRPTETEVARLRTSVAEQARAAGNVLCRSLAEEAHQLRRTLAATAHMCQQLARCLEERQQVGRGVKTPNEPEPSGDTVELVTLREENRLLREKVAHVEDLNARWQRYDASRDEYVRGLQTQLGGARAEHPLEGPPQTVLLRTEIARLNRQLEETLGKCAEARRELVATREARDAALERGQVLEQQLLVYKDDFSSERADRERAQSRVQELEDKVAALQCQVSGRQGMWEPGHTLPEIRPPQHLEMDAPEPGCHTSVSTNLESPAEARSADSDPKAQGDLQCPHCLQRFHDELGEELLQHVDNCCQ